MDDAHIQRITLNVDLVDTVFVGLSLVSTAVFISTVRATSSLHGNIRFLLVLIAVQFRVYGVARLLGELAFKWDARAAWTSVFCACMSFAHAVALGFVQLCFMTVIVERAIATRYHATYDAWGNRLARLLFAALSAYAVLFGGATVLLDAADAVPSEHAALTCIAAVRRPIIMIFSWVIFGLCMGAGLAPIIYLYYYNRKMSLIPAKGTLATRYQYHDNLVILRLFLPLIVGGVFGVGGFGLATMGSALSTIIAGKALDAHMYMMFKIVLFLTDVCATGYELVCLAFHPSLRATFKRRFLVEFGCLARSACEERPWRPPTEVAEEGAVYFRQLSASWH